MTKERLKEYRALKHEEAQLEQELRELLESSYIGGVVLDGMPKAGGLGDITSKLACETVMLYGRLNKKKLEAVRMRNEIEDCFEILDAEERTLMREKYIYGKNWEQVCIVVNVSWRTAHRIHIVALKKLEAMVP